MEELTEKDGLSLAGNLSTGLTGMSVAAAGWGAFATTAAVALAPETAGGSLVALGLIALGSSLVGDVGFAVGIWGFDSK